MCCVVGILARGVGVFAGIPRVVAQLWCHHNVYTGNFVSDCSSLLDNSVFM